MKIFALMLSLILLAGISACTPQPTVTGEETENFSNADIEAGKALFNNPNLGNTDKSCNSCHPNGEGLSDVTKKYERKKLAAIINKCITSLLKGDAMPENGTQIKQIIAYLSSL